MAQKLAASDRHIGKVSGLAHYREVRLTLDTAAYAAGDVLSDVFRIPDVFRAPGQAIALVEVGVLDEDDQGIAFDILFFRNQITTAAKNAAWATADNVMQTSSYIGKIVRVTGGDYVDLGGNRVANLVQLNRMFQSTGPGRDLWGATVSQGAGTYSANGLTLSFSFLEM